MTHHSGTVGKRPDRAAAMKSAYPGAVDTKWLKAEVQEALDDTSPMIPHDEAMRQIRAAIKIHKGNACTSYPGKSRPSTT